MISWSDHQILLKNIIS